MCLAHSLSARLTGCVCVYVCLWLERNESTIFGWNYNAHGWFRLILFYSDIFTPTRSEKQNLRKIVDYPLRRLVLACDCVILIFFFLFEIISITVEMCALDIGCGERGVIRVAGVIVLCRRCVLSSKRLPWMRGAHQSERKRHKLVTFPVKYCLIFHIGINNE